MKSKFFSVIFIIISGGIFLSGCISWQNGQKPVYPPHSQHRFGLFTVNSLTPTFEWTKYTDPKAEKIVYDFKIYMIKYSGMFILTTSQDILYSKEGLRENIHTIDKELEPNKNYFWGVRVRSLRDGKWKEHDWNTYSIIYCIPKIPKVSGDERNASYEFKTPQQ